MFCSYVVEESVEKEKGQERKVKRDMILMTSIVRRNLQRTKVSEFQYNQNISWIKKIVQQITTVILTF